LIFWVVDVAALALNAILAYGVATGTIDPGLMQWQQLSPATPLLAVIGWGVAFLLDPSHKLRHAQAELEADLIDIHAAQLRQAAKGEIIAETIITGAKQAAADTAAKLTGRAVTPAASPSPTIAAARVRDHIASGDDDDVITAPKMAVLEHSDNGHSPKAKRARG